MTVALFLTSPPRHRPIFHEGEGLSRAPFVLARRLGSRRSLAWMIPPLRTLPPYQIDTRKGRVEHTKEKQSDAVHLYQVPGSPVGQETQDRECFRFMQKESVVITGIGICDYRNDEIKFRPRKDAHDRHWIRPIFMHEHQKNHAGDDTAMRNEKTEKPKIGETVGKIWRQNGLQRSTQSPEIGDFEPALVTRQHRDNHHDHSPIAKLQRQNLLPADRAESPHQ